jgi:hypothetical protein
MTSITASGPGPAPLARRGRYAAGLGWYAAQQGRYDAGQLPGPLARPGPAPAARRGPAPAAHPGPASAERPGPASAAPSVPGETGSRSWESAANAVPGVVHGAVRVLRCRPGAVSRTAPGTQRGPGDRYDIVPPTRCLSAAMADLNSALAEQVGPYTRAAVTDERRWLAALEAGRSEPVTELRPRGAVGMTDGPSLVQMSITGPTPASRDDAVAPLKTGRELAAAMLAKGADGLMGERAL